MEPEQIPQLIAQIALADPRIRREDPTERRAQIVMWAGILTDVPYDLAVRAAQDHYATSTWPILPAEIATRWQATVRDRMTRHNGTFEPTAHPDLDPDDVTGYITALRGERQAVVLGHTAPAPVKAITAGPAAEEAARRLQELGSYVPRHVDDLLDSHRPVKAARRAAITAGQPDALSVACDWCQAPAGEPCRSRRVDPNGATTNRRRSTPHPTRTEAAVPARVAEGDGGRAPGPWRHRRGVHRRPPALRASAPYTLTRPPTATAEPTDQSVSTTQETTMNQPLTEQQLDEIQAAVTAYQQHAPTGFACCTAHPVADAGAALLADVRRLRDRVADLEAWAHGCDGEGCVLPHSSWCEAAKKTAAENDGCTCPQPWKGHPQPHAGYCWLVSPPRDEVEQMRRALAERSEEAQR